MTMSTIQVLLELCSSIACDKTTTAYVTEAVPPDEGGTFTRVIYIFSVDGREYSNVVLSDSIYKKGTIDIRYCTSNPVISTTATLPKHWYHYTLQLSGWAIVLIVSIRIKMLFKEMKDKLETQSANEHSW